MAAHKVFVTMVFMGLPYEDGENVLKIALRLHQLVKENPSESDDSISQKVDTYYHELFD